MYLFEVTWKSWVVFPNPVLFSQPFNVMKVNELVDSSVKIRKQDLFLRTQISFSHYDWIHEAVVASPDHPSSRNIVRPGSALKCQKHVFLKGVIFMSNTFYYSQFHHRDSMLINEIGMISLKLINIWYKRNRYLIQLPDSMLTKKRWQRIIVGVDSQKSTWNCTYPDPRIVISYI